MRSFFLVQAERLPAKGGINFSSLLFFNKKSPSFPDGPLLRTGGETSRQGRDKLLLSPLFQ